jgi:hypothetical protein
LIRNFRILSFNVNTQKEISETQQFAYFPFVAAEYDEFINNNIVNADRANSSIIIRKNRKRLIKLDNGVRKRQKKGILIAIHNYSEFISESGIRNYLNHEKRIFEFEIKIENFNEYSEEIKIKIIIILDDRLRHLEAEKKKLNNTIKNRDRIIIILNYQVAVLETE